ncbi:MAG: alpha/beta hydrolase [Lachnospiraceae bacterium]
MDRIKLYKRHKVHKALKVIGVILGIFLAFGIGIYFFLTTHTQILVGMIQKEMYGDSSPNSFEPLNTPGKGVTANGQYKINDIAYGTEYPNSFLDITYPDSNMEIDRPTLFYFHGGGFFGGSKCMGDPMAANEVTALLDDICAQGYNLVNVDYALVPDYHFPVPLIQINEAIRFIKEHKDEYHINMDNIILMGSSAGAIMTAQYGTVISNAEYAALLNIEPSLEREQVSAVVIDDGPIDYRNMTLRCKLLIGNYVKGSIYLNQDELNRYECIPHMTSDYPAAFLLGSEYRNDMVAMAEKLKATGAEYILVDPLTEYGEVKPHCFVANERIDSIAKEAFERLNVFLKEKTEEEIK